jgi:hypothetical protein
MGTLPASSPSPSPGGTLKRTSSGECSTILSKRSSGFLTRSQGRLDNHVTELRPEISPLSLLYLPPFAFNIPHFPSQECGCSHLQTCVGLSLWPVPGQRLLGASYHLVRAPVGAAASDFLFLCELWLGRDTSLVMRMRQRTDKMIPT